MSATGSQDALQMHPDAKAALKRHPDPSKEYSFLAGTAMEEAATDMPKSSLKGMQDQSKQLLYSICSPTSADYWIWAFRNKAFGSKSTHFPNNFHMLVSIPSHLQFCKDVLSVLHVFDIRQHYILASTQLLVVNFLTYFSSLCQRD